MLDLKSFAVGMVEGGGGGGTSDYEQLSNLPSINGTTLIGNVTLGASDVGALPDDTPIPADTSDLTNGAGFQTWEQVTEAINDKVSGLYKPGGAATLATLPPLTAANSGYVYEMSETFTTTADFREGAGHEYPAGTNVVVADVGNNAYKYDALSGILDGYVKKDGNKVLSDNNYTTAEKAAVATIGDKVDKVSGKGLSTEDYTTAEKSKLAGIAANATANVAATAAPLMDGTAAVGTSAKYAREDHRHETDTSRAAAADVAALQAENAVFREYFANMEVYRTASGNPATFSDGYAANVRKLAVTLTPTQSGSGDPSPDNIRPISGVSSVTVMRTGENLWQFGDEELSFYERYLWFTVPLAAGTYTVRLKTTSPVTSETAWKLLGPNGESYRVPVRRGETEAVGAISPTVHCNRSYIFANKQTGNTLSVTLARGTDSLPIDTPYQGTSVTVPLLDGNNQSLTVYGGTLDVTAGTLAVTWANIASYDGETLPGRWISDRDVYSAGTSPTTGAQVVYELASPVTYNLTAQSLAALSGYNAVSANAGSVTVEYRADVGLSLGG